MLHVIVFSMRRSGYCYLKSVQDPHLVPRTFLNNLVKLVYGYYIEVRIISSPYYRLTNSSLTVTLSQYNYWGM